MSIMMWNSIISDKLTSTVLGDINKVRSNK